MFEYCLYVLHVTRKAVLLIEDSSHFGRLQPGSDVVHDKRTIVSYRHQKNPRGNEVLDVRAWRWRVSALSFFDRIPGAPPTKIIEVGHGALLVIGTWMYVQTRCRRPQTWTGGSRKGFIFIGITSDEMIRIFFLFFVFFLCVLLTQFEQ